MKKPIFQGRTCVYPLLFYRFGRLGAEGFLNPEEEGKFFLQAVNG